MALRLQRRHWGSCLTGEQVCSSRRKSLTVIYKSLRRVLTTSLTKEHFHFSSHKHKPQLIFGCSTQVTKWISDTDNSSPVDDSWLLACLLWRLVVRWHTGTGMFSMYVRAPTAASTAVYWSLTTFQDNTPHNRSKTHNTISLYRHFLFFRHAVDSVSYDCIHPSCYIWVPNSCPHCSPYRAQTSYSSFLISQHDTATPKWSTSQSRRRGIVAVWVKTTSQQAGTRMTRCSCKTCRIMVQSTRKQKCTY